MPVHSESRQPRTARRQPARGAVPARSRAFFSLALMSSRRRGGSCARARRRSRDLCIDFARDDPERLPTPRAVRTTRARRPPRSLVRGAKEPACSNALPSAPGGNLVDHALDDRRPGGASTLLRALRGRRRDPGRLLAGEAAQARDAPRLRPVPRDDVHQLVPVGLRVLPDAVVALSQLRVRHLSPSSQICGT